MTPQPRPDTDDELVQLYGTLVEDLAATLDLAAGAAEAAQPHHLTRLTSDLSSVLDLDAGLAAVIGLHARAGAAQLAARELPVSPVETARSAEEVTVHYRIRRRSGARRFARRHYEMLVTAEQDCVLPDLVLVEGHKKDPPTEVGEGEIVGWSPSRQVVAGETVVIAVDLLGPGPSWLVCLVEHATVADDIALLLPYSAALTMGTWKL